MAKKPMEEEEKTMTAKGVIVVVALVVGSVCATNASRWVEIGVLGDLAIGLVCSVAYLLVGRVVVPLLDGLCKWAKWGEMSQAGKIFAAAFWPLSAPAIFTGAILSGLVERLF